MMYSIWNYNNIPYVKKVTNNMKIKTSTKFMVAALTACVSPFVTWRIYHWYYTRLDELGKAIGWNDNAIGLMEFLTSIIIIACIVIGILLKVVDND
jgi:hypothetical protein